ncbi:alpha/beta hydrolase [Rubinisphaera margarita]|uniref:alpha/beta hydrolase n=1 Tax=Rubinisphaera margarita TaxID=2909586 RepID=UPI001EE823F1|nr:alpha/beta hydrolase [Rubinisphaera margarita]MCG6156067.1 alpha/beta hydrolase [Rubinisphaera margarita]
MRSFLWILCFVFCSPALLHAQEVIKLWPDNPPGEPLEVGPEEDITKPNDRLIAGKRIIKLANVAEPEVHVYLPPQEKRNGTSVVICPGGGFSILAWDLEGTEAAEWLNNLGVTAVVLKYRVPTRNRDVKWEAAAQDAQRAISLVRSRSEEWMLNPDRVGVLGFSAGGHTAARAALAGEKRYYETQDDIDKWDCRPNMAMLIYPAYLDEGDGATLADGLVVNASSPQMFIVHAFDDRISVTGSLALALELKQAGVAFDLHVYDTGGHGYGLRPVPDQPVTSWPNRCADWMKRNGWLKAEVETNSKAKQSEQ